jgi:hypothetical protein
MNGDLVFTSKRPALIVVDDFYNDPDQVRATALHHQYHSDERYFKGERSTQPALWPWVREEFSRLIGAPIVNWMDESANGVFQKTTSTDPLVYHSDSQDYAAAVYLSPKHDAGTCFWRYKDETRRFTSEMTVDPSEYTDGTNFHLLDKVAGLYNRLVIWDGTLIHSAESYEEFTDEPRLVHLYFFNVQKEQPTEDVVI